MTMIVRIDDLYLNLDNVTRIEVLTEEEEVRISFAGASECDGLGPFVDNMTLSGERGARLLKWLDAGGRVSVA